MCALTHTQRSRRRSVYAYADEHQYVKNQAVGSGVVVTSGTGGGATVAQPAVDAQNSRCAEHHPDSPLRAAVGPSRAQPAALCFFKQKINRALKARLAAWEVQVRTAISDQLTGRLHGSDS